MAIKKYVGYDSNGRKFEYELDDHVVIKHNGDLVTNEQDSRTKTKRVK